MQHHYEGHWKGWALKIKTFWAQTALTSLFAISGPKKVEIFKANPFQCPEQ
jgi:hypothetical protein